MVINFEELSKELQNEVFVWGCYSSCCANADCGGEGWS